jgi:hypothetical protein
MASNPANGGLYKEVIANQRLEDYCWNVIVCRIPQTRIERDPAMCDPFARGSIALRVIRVSKYSRPD